MPIYATTEAKAFWRKGHARSLAASHFCHLKTWRDGKTDESYRKASAEGIQKGTIRADAPDRHAEFLTRLTGSGVRAIYARLEARLILNSSGGVIENGGICLDRNSGVPYIPGSAIKGCARRSAIRILSQEPGSAGKAELLANICLAFGYGDTEWKPGRHPAKKHSHSDFWLAMAPLEQAGPQHDQERNALWAEVSVLAREILANALGMDSPPRQLQGCVAFLPSFPQKDPGIDLDILTCHHQDYYDGKSEKATDDERPNPVIFPTVAQGATFVFSVLPLPGRCTPALLDLSKQWLSEGLQLSGLGGKTNAGYGWFSIDTKAAERAIEERQKQEETLAKEKELAAMTPEERLRTELAALSDDLFANKVRTLAQLPAEEQKAICTLLASAKAAQWADWCKPKSKKWTSRIPGIRDLAASHDIQLP